MINLFKQIDRSIGTPLCYFFGIWNKLNPKPALKPNQIEKILIVKWIGLGDVILTLPTVVAIRKRYPNAKIVYFTTPRSQMPLKYISEIDEVISYDIIGKDKGIKGLINIISKLRSEKFDVAIELTQRYRLISLITFFAGIPHRIGFGIRGQGREWLLTNTTPYPWTTHEAEAFSQIGKLINVQPITMNILPRLTIPTEESKIPAIKQMLQYKKPIMAIHISTGPALKARQWSAKKFSQLISRLLQQQNGTVIITGAKDDINFSKQILIDSHPQIINAVGKTSLLELYQLFEKTNLIISMDTGPMHLAAMSGAPTLGIFLAGYPAKWRPYGANHRFIYNGPDIDPYNPKRHPPVQTVRDISIDEVLEIVLRMI